MKKRIVMFLTIAAFNTIIASSVMADNLSTPINASEICLHLLMLPR